MSKDKAREVYKEDYEVIPKLDPFVEFPRMRVSAINRINELIERDKALPIVIDGYDDRDKNEKRFACPSCEIRIYEDYNFCPCCGQRLNQEVIAF